MTDPTWEDEWARKAEGDACPAPSAEGKMQSTCIACVPPHEDTPVPAGAVPALVCIGCGGPIVLKMHLTKARTEQGTPASHSTSLFGEEVTVYTMLDADHREHRLVVADKENDTLPSKDGWVANPLAEGQGLQVAQGATTLDDEDEDDDDDGAVASWFRGHSRTPASCKGCGAPVGWLFEPDAMFALANLMNQELGATVGLVPFYGVRLELVREDRVILDAPSMKRRTSTEGGEVEGEAGGDED